MVVAVTVDVVAVSMGINDSCEYDLNVQGVTVCVLYNVGALPLSIPLYSLRRLAQAPISVTSTFRPTRLASSSAPLLIR